MENYFILSSALILAGSILGFLVFNYNPAKIFMGDNGSYFIGGTIALLSSWLVMERISVTSFIGLILLTGVPVFDAFFAFSRRIYNKKSPFTGDRSHFYDLMIQKGFSVKKTVNLVYIVQMAVCSFGILIIIAEFQI